MKTILKKPLISVLVRRAGMSPALETAGTPHTPTPGCMSKLREVLGRGSVAPIPRPDITGMEPTDYRAAGGASTQSAALAPPLLQNPGVVDRQIRIPLVLICVDAVSRVSINGVQTMWR